MDDFDFGGVMDVAGFATDAEDPSLSPLNKKKRRTDKGKAIAEATTTPRSVSTYHQGCLLWRRKYCVIWRNLKNGQPIETMTRKKLVAEVQSLLDKAIAESKKKDNENAYLQKEVDQLRKKLETADDEAIAGYKMSAEYKSNLHMYGAESLKAAIKMTKEWLVDDHSEIDPDEFDRYLRKRRAADLAAQKAKVTNHGGVGSQLAGSLDN
ncbi:hypothetical protein Adt_41552 [Abeliophyllum distichum]|uniref:Uncharacterized protein n=1 Tax=Abeliophyllum distichum TaxID=126358 RepID=A0ABD1PT30_9LAMI